MKKTILDNTYWTGFIFTQLVLVALSNPTDALAITPEEKGLEIAKKMDRKDTGWQNFKAHLTMILKNKQGERSIRQLRSRTLENPDDGDKSLLLFDSPLDVKNTVFLTIAHKRKDDDQWLYLPALKRVKRISSSNKGGAFMGSEFSYEDMSPPIVEKYTYKHLRDEKFKGRPCHIVERYPSDDRSLYKKHIVWIDSKQYIPWKIEYYNRRNKHLKTLAYRKYKRYLKEFWRPGEMYMLNLRTRKSTVLAWRNYQFRANIVEQDFNQQRLSRTR